MSKEKTNAARLNYRQAQIEALASLDVPAQAAALGLETAADGRAAAEFLGRRYLIGRSGVEAAPGGAPPTVDAQSVLAHYLASRGRGEPSGEFVPMGRLTGIHGTSASPSENLAKPLSDRFGSDYGLFERAAPAVGGAYRGLSQAGARSWEFGLPKVPMRIEFFEADEEFGAEIRLLFDSHANRFVSYECLELMTMCLVVDILLAAGLISDPEDCANSFL
jgi:hypothetical protein